MKKIATATIATAGIATFAFANHDAQAAENNNGGYNPNDPTSYSYSYTIDQQGNYHYTWQGNWSPDKVNHNNSYDYGYNTQAYNNYNNYNYNNYDYGYNTQAYNTPQRTGGLGASYSATSHNVHVTTTSAPSSNGGNLYTAGQCTYYVYDRVGGKVGSTWGNANNWANAAAAAGYTVNNRPAAGAILQTTQGGFGHVAYVESVNSDGSIRVSEMNYGHGPGVVTSRTISASQAGSYNYIH
ncbi:CHAP domain-containing protein [Staphylococcus warneri]|uniref:CHAP domain-containing protein n=1 Tax=Staphylococcus warneri TaxID=1292 RepID=UPI001888010F|nr:CHAP domain-containing protein [Staphylococcus warneri]MBF2178441.1 CHAP domain-containing protein [Staphylococcus warneri]MBF2180090.1 CHAP domain-containing protein [Staphylococcus warneri]MBF2184604.1 CHAP domain-containing protein [Staphylococcus warneri]